MKKKVPLGDALAKVIQIYKSCKTIKHYIAASKYKSLFRTMYKLDSLPIEVIIEVNDVLYQADSKALIQIEKHRE